jgi:hypothetical protein
MDKCLFARAPEGALRLWLTGCSLALLLSASACTEVDNCERGEEGCIGGACIDDTDCKLDLKCVVEIGSGDPVCGKEDEDGSGAYDCGDVNCREGTGVGDGDGDGDAPIACNCVGTNQLCVSGTADQCVNYCEDPGFELNVSDRRNNENLPCRVDLEGNPVSYQNACKAAFRQFCLRAEVYCNGGPAPFVCPPGFVDSQDAQAFCLQEYPNIADLATYCESMRDSTCANFAECVETPVNPGDPIFPKSCANQGVCTNSCSDANDGACDDGDLGTAAYGVCDWGTDCGDCGPRTGTPPTLPIPIGGLCVSHAQCTGYSEDLRNNGSWCLKVRATGVFRCMSDCTLDDDCSTGYKCTTLVDENNRPIGQGDLEARVCDPQMCI